MFFTATSDSFYIRFSDLWIFIFENVFNFNLKEEWWMYFSRFWAKIKFYSGQVTKFESLISKAPCGLTWSHQFYYCNQSSVLWAAIIFLRDKVTKSLKKDMSLMKFELYEKWKCKNYNFEIDYGKKKALSRNYNFMRNEINNILEKMLQHEKQ